MDKGSLQAAVHGVTELDRTEFTCICIPKFNSKWSFCYLFVCLHQIRASWVAQMVKKKKSACDVGDLCLVLGLGISPVEGHGNPLQFSCMETPHGHRSLVACRPWGHKESDKT